MRIRWGAPGANAIPWVNRITGGVSAKKCNPVDHFIGELLDADEFVGPVYRFTRMVGPLRPHHATWVKRISLALALPPAT
jgi:hypothetical protein